MPLALLCAVAELRWSLPSPAYALFEWLTRVLPSVVITSGTDAMLRVIHALKLGPTAEAAKQAEHVLAISIFLALAALVGALLGAAQHRSARRARSIAATRTAPATINLRRRRTLAFLVATSATLTAASLGMLRWFGRGARTLAAKVPLADLLASTHGPAASPDGAALQRRPAAVPGTRPELTSTADFYRIDINLTPPNIDPVRWRLDVAGLVEQPLSLSLDELRERPSVSQAITLECISNPVAGDLISTAVFTGVRLKHVLAEARMKPEARAVFAQAADGFFETIVMSDIADDRTLLVYAMNGVPLPRAHGFPLRVYIPNRYGMKQPKWITRLEAIADERPGYWVKRGWDREAMVKTTSVIDATPQAAGQAEMGGIAFGGARGIARVEVQIDDATWHDATLRAPPIAPLTWVQWRYSWSPTAGRHRVRVRAYDGRGQLQPVATAAAASRGSVRRAREVDRSRRDPRVGERATVTEASRRRSVTVMLRIAKPTDHAPLLELMDAFNRAERIEMRREVTGPALDRLLADPSLGHVIVADDYSAYAVFTWGFDLEFGGRDAFLTEIYVVPKRRRERLGRRLLDEVLRVAKREGAGAVHLGVYPENGAALSLYESVGFRKIPRDFYTWR